MYGCVGVHVVCMTLAVWAAVVVQVYYCSLCMYANILHIDYLCDSRCCSHTFPWMYFSCRGTLMPHTRLRLTRALKFGGCMAACERPVGTMGENSIGLFMYTSCCGFSSSLETVSIFCEIVSFAVPMHPAFVRWSSVCEKLVHAVTHARCLRTHRRDNCRVCRGGIRQLFFRLQRRTF